MAITSDPQRLGASVSVGSSAALALLPPDGFTLGSAVWNKETETLFRLLLSTDPLSATVVEVFGTSGVRWIGETPPAGDVTSIIAGDGISVDASTGDVTVTNTGVTSIIAGTGITVDQASGDVTVSAQPGTYVAQTNPDPIQLSARPLTLILNDAVTSTPTVLTETRHNTSGTPVAGYGSDDDHELQDGAGNNILASVLSTYWKTTNATYTPPNDSAYAVKVVKAGVLTTVATFGNVDNTSESPFDLPTKSTDGNAVALTLSAAGDTEIRKTANSGNLIIRQNHNAHNASVGLFTANFAAIRAVQAQGGYPDVVIGPGATLGIGDFSGWAWISAITDGSSGPPSSPPEETHAGTVPLLPNTADGKIYTFMGGAWRYVQTDLTTDLAVNLLNAALTDANAGLAVGTASEFTAAPALLTATRTLTLSTTGATTGENIRIVRHDVSAHQLVIVNGGVGAGTLYTFPNSQARVADFTFSGTDWILGGHSQLAS